MLVTHEQVLETVNRVQAELPESANWTAEEKQLANLLATVATKSVLELLQQKQAGAPTNHVADGDFPVVFAEWAQQFTIKTHYDRFCAIMWYLREHKSERQVSTTEISQMYEKSRWKKPKNLADVFAKGAERLLFTEANRQSDEGLKLWEITKTGHDHLMSLQMEV